MKKGTRGKKELCKEICKNSYLKEHVRILTSEQKYPDEETRKLIQKNCIKKICNPECDKTGLEETGYPFHPDYSKEEINHIKSIDGLSLCHPPIPKFNIMALNNMKCGRKRKTTTKTAKTTTTTKTTKKGTKRKIRRTRKRKQK